jgi:beta-lactamase class A
MVGRRLRTGLTRSIGLALVALLASSGASEIATTAAVGSGDRAPRRAQRPPRAYPQRASLVHAWRYAKSRPGIASLAVVDSHGRLHQRKGHRRFVSASVVKAMMLAAYLREAAAGRQPLDGSSREVLARMITYSDNGAADDIYYRLGDSPLRRLARRLRLRDLSVEGYWASTYLSATDCARFMWRLGRALPDRYERFGRRLLAGIVSYQRWGIPAGAGKGWRIWFKGGWRGTALGQLTSQMALLRHGRVRIAIAVLTDGNPSQLAGQRTIEGVARRLLRRRRASAELVPARASASARARAARGRG